MRWDEMRIPPLVLWFLVEFWLLVFSFLMGIGAITFEVWSFVEDIFSANGLLFWIRIWFEFGFECGLSLGSMGEIVGGEHSHTSNSYKTCVDFRFGQQCSLLSERRASKSTCTPSLSRYLAVYGLIDGLSFPCLWLMCLRRLSPLVIDCQKYFSDARLRTLAHSLCNRV